MVKVKVHNRSGYARGCRCDTCRDDAVAANRERRERRRLGLVRPVDAVATIESALGGESPGWFELAECRGASSSTFYVGAGESPEPARAICRRCPVAGDCLAHALDNGEMYGIWGGATERERARMRRTWRKRT